MWHSIERDPFARPDPYRQLDNQRRNRLIITGMDHYNEQIVSDFGRRINSAMFHFQRYFSCKLTFGTIGAINIVVRRRLLMKKKQKAYLKKLILY